MPLTATGVELFQIVLPLPSMPKRLLPQHCSSPMRSTAHVVEPTAETDVAVLMLLVPLRASADPAPSDRAAAEALFRDARDIAPPTLNRTTAENGARV